MDNDFVEGAVVGAVVGGVMSSSKSSDQATPVAQQLIGKKVKITKEERKFFVTNPNAKWYQSCGEYRIVETEYFGTIEAFYLNGTEPRILVSFPNGRLRRYNPLDESVSLVPVKE